MTNPVPFERRLAKVEADATAALELARAHDRDIAELPLKVDANRQAINALGLQVAGRFEQVDRRFEQVEQKVDAGFATADANFARINANFAQINIKFAQIDAKFEQVDAGFAEMRFRFDQTAAGLAHLADLLERREPDGQ